MFFCIGVSTFRRNSHIKDGIYGVENSIFLYIVYEVVSIVLIPNEYYQFRVWCEFVGTNFNRKKYIGSTAKDTGIQCFGFVLQENLLRYSLLETSDKYVIIYMSYSYYCKLLL